jgi:hypothetical protein
MDHHDLTGYYTYRSFHNRPEPVDDFNVIRFAEGEWFLFVAPDGTISGTLAFPADPFEDEKDFLDVTGRVTSWSPASLELTGVGRQGTATEAFHYTYQGSLAPSFLAADRQRSALIGTVLRAKPHGSAPAGFTASFVAVKRDFLPPKQIEGAALIPEAISMFASRSHRLQHAVWHTVRMRWHVLNGDPDAVAAIDERGWWPKRPPFLDTGALNLENAAGEDFLFMHRKMILMLKDVYAAAGQAAPAGWTELPASNVAQMVYKAATPAGTTGGVFDPEASGFMVPPPRRDDEIDRMMKSPAFLSGVMRPMQRLFKSQRFLSALPLGQLGTLMEFTIHGWMHNRWMHTEYDPESGQPIERSLYDIDPRWDDPANDHLGDFYSSHVHTTFWRLHGWIDDRITDWATVNAPRIQAATIDGVPWFAADGHLVQVSDPFTWPSHGHHTGGHDEVRVLEEVMGIMQGADPDFRIAAPQPAVLAFRDVLLGIDLPDLE